MSSFFETIYHSQYFYHTTQTEIRVASCMLRTNTWQNFDSYATSLFSNFNDRMMRNKQFSIPISDRIEY